MLDARQHYDRIQKVYDDTAGSAITSDELTSARLNYENKAAQLEQAQQSLNLAQAGTRYKEIIEARLN